MKKIIVLKDEKNGKKIAFVRQSDTMVLILKILTILNICACVFSTLMQNYIVALFDLAISFFVYIISRYDERNNEIFDFFDNSENNLKQ